MSNVLVRIATNVTTEAALSPHFSMLKPEISAHEKGSIDTKINTM